MSFLAVDAYLSDDWANFNSSPLRCEEILPQACGALSDDQGGITMHVHERLQSPFATFHIHARGWSLRDLLLNDGVSHFTRQCLDLLPAALES